MRIYLDNCCYNRPYDDLKQDRIRLEAEAVMSILRLAEIGEWNILGSDVLDVEINKIKNIERRQRVALLYHIIDDKIEYTNRIRELALEIQKSANIKLYDSLHLASAVIGKADVFLSTDDKLIKACRKLTLDICIANPVIWFMEVKA